MAFAASARCLATVLIWAKSLRRATPLGGGRPTQTTGVRCARPIATSSAIRWPYSAFHASLRNGAVPVSVVMSRTSSEPISTTMAATRRPWMMPRTRSPRVSALGPARPASLIDRLSTRTDGTSE